ncbi:hypothetical protein ODJ79_03145 [Actinoplanes sp. KI2]|uniref:hypothetical protein n=1 Tax=Actinoplanes sp. KI2 TaxID=2983315 RepID=UPI0021D58937|nr:hypothetical protein [Actinoplanes sp. KI2]MCU7722702.1 hypothetical protein [Actinoplanes sp. KI2]
MSPEKTEEQAREVANQATCRTVNSAIAAYVALNDKAPVRITDLTEYVDGDITAYRIVGGVAAGPGCKTHQPR